MKKHKIKKGMNAVLKGKKTRVTKAEQDRVIYAPDSEKVSEKPDNALTKEERQAKKKQKRIKGKK